MRKMLAVIGIVGLCWSAVPAEETAGKSTGLPSSHTVTKGDTLWDLAGRYYGNSFLWPSLWEINRSTVTDPNLIYPDQVLSLPPTLKKPAAAQPAAEAPAAAPPAGEEAAASEEGKQEAAEAPAGEEAAEAPTEDEANEEETAGEETAEAPVAGEKEEELAPADTDEREGVSAGDEQAIGDYFSVQGIIVPPGWEADAFIVGDKDKKIMISSGDTVYIDMGEGKVTKGTKGTIYRKIRKVNNRATGEFMGYELHRIGTIRVAEVSEKAATAEVLVSYDPIKLGDMIKLTEK